MNQIPNIEETEALSEKIHHLYCAQYEKDHGEPYWTNGDYSKLDERTKEYDRNIARFIHQQLQKAREDWLRSEIEKLEGQMKDNVFVPDHNPSPYGGLICRECRMQEDCDCHVYNEALTSIITRYKEELLEL